MLPASSQPQQRPILERRRPAADESHAERKEGEKWINKISFYLYFTILKYNK
jgi:hypothetical protein